MFLTDPSIFNALSNKFLTSSFESYSLLSSGLKLRAFSSVISEVGFAGSRFGTSLATLSTNANGKFITLPASLNEPLALILLKAMIWAI